MIKITPNHYDTVVLLGGGGVGKSSLTLRLMTNNFLDDYDATIEDSYRKTINVDDEISNIEILDTAGQEEFHSLVDGWIRSSEAVILVYDVSNRQTFDEVKSFYERVVEAKDTVKFPLVLVGNKCDVSDNRRKVDKIEGQRLAQSWRCPFIEASAKEKINDKLCFYEIVREIRKLDSSRKKEKKDGFCLIL